MICDIFNDIKDEFIELKNMPYYYALSEGKFNKEDTMRAQLQDLGRSLGCKDLRSIQTAKLIESFNSNIVSYKDYISLLSAIKDEDETHNKQSHLDMRLQIFEGICPKEVLLTVDPLLQVKEANKSFRDIFDRSLLEITATIGAIELWYFPIAEFLESQYLKRGYTQRQVYTYTIHKTADIAHSKIALDFVARHIKSDEERKAVIKSIRDGFRTTMLYDEARYSAAINKDRTFESYLKWKTKDKYS